MVELSPANLVLGPELPLSEPRTRPRGPVQQPSGQAGGRTDSQGVKRAPVPSASQLGGGNATQVLSLSREPPRFIQCEAAPLSTCHPPMTRRQARLGSAWLETVRSHTEEEETPQTGELKPHLVLHF